MIVPSLSPADLTILHAALHDVALTMAQAQAQGGGTWTGTRATGNGITAPVGTTTISGVTGYAMQVNEPSVTATPLPSFQSVTRWLFVADAAQDVQPGDRLRSDIDATIAFQVMVVNGRPGYVECLVEPTV
jgi:hypothetical protein